MVGVPEPRPKPTRALNHRELCHVTYSFSIQRSGGAYLNFDLAFPSQAIPSDFFPSNASYYGYTVSSLILTRQLGLNSNAGFWCLEC